MPLQQKRDSMEPEETVWSMLSVESLAATPLSNPPLKRKTEVIHQVSKCNIRPQRREGLQLMRVITEVWLIIYAVIVIISLGMVFFIVGIAIRLKYFKG